MKVRDLKKRAEKAWTRRQLYDKMLRDVYDYVLPMRDVSGLHNSTSTGAVEAASRVDKVFDGTAVKAAFRFAGRLQTELTPIFQPFFALEAGPLIQDPNERKVLTEKLQEIAAIVNGVLASGSYHNSAHEMYVDLYAGTAHMLVQQGDDHDLVRFIVVPVQQVAVEEGPYGNIEHWFYKRRWPADQLKVMWPKGKFSEELLTQINADEPAEVEVCQYTYFDRAAGDYKLVVWCDKNGDADEPFHTESFRTSPWISPRFFKIPGEPYGRGPAQMAMPFIKTANKTRELQLKAAALALMGIWAYRNDGVFNPDTVKFEPMAMWPVASTGGPMGPTLQNLRVAQDFEISGIIMADEREQMKQALFDDTLPPDGSAVRSATEVAERISRLSQDLSGVYGRLTLEIVVPLVRRVIDILERAGRLKTSLKIDQLLTQVRVVSPIAAGQSANKVQAAAHWGEICNLLSPGSFRKVSKEAELLTNIGRWIGVEESLINSVDDIKKQAAGEAKMAAEQHAANVAKALPDGPSPAEQIVNGGVM